MRTCMCWSGGGRKHSPSHCSPGVLVMQNCTWYRGLLRGGEGEGHSDLREHQAGGSPGSACCLGGEQDEETGQVTSRAWMAQQMYLYSGCCMDFSIKGPGTTQEGT